MDQRSSGVAVQFGNRDECSSADHKEALLRILEVLAGAGYDFTAPTPSTHARVVGRPSRRTGKTVADLLGWNLPCSPEDIDDELIETLSSAGLLSDEGVLVRAGCRVSRIFEHLFIHSAYPTEAKDSVFLGPDSHRFADFIRRQTDHLKGSTRILDYGAGAGVGGITAAHDLCDAELLLADINPRALFFASINATFAGIRHHTRQVTSPADIVQRFDLIVSNPPFMIDAAHRAYRDGGAMYGAQMSLEWALAAVERLQPEGRLIMYTGAPIVAGRDVFHDALNKRLSRSGFDYSYHVLDTDIFGDELGNDLYADVDRIAAVGLCIGRA